MPGEIKINFFQTKEAPAALRRCAMKIDDLTAGLRKCAIDLEHGGDPDETAERVAELLEALDEALDE